MKTRVAACLLSGLFALAPQVVLAAEAPTALDKFQNSDACVKAGESAAAQGNWRLAKREFESAVAADSESVVAYYDLGVAQGHLGEFEEAARCEQRAVELDPHYAAAYIELGWIHSRLKNFEQSVAAERRALELDPGNKTAQKNLDAVSRVYSRGKQPVSVLGMSGGVHAPEPAVTTGDAPEMLVGSARETYTTAQRVQVLLTTGDQAFKAGQLEIARRNFDQAITLDSENAQAHACLGVVLGRMGNIEGEIAEEQHALQLDSKDAWAYNNTGWAQAKKQRWSESLRAYRSALSIKPDMLEAQVGVALALFNTGKKEQAVAQLQEAKDKHPEAASPCITLGVAFAQQSDDAAAEKEFRQALKLQPDSSEARLQLAITLLHTGDAVEAASLFRSIADSTAQAAAAHAGLSLALERQGDHSGAQQEAQRALDLDPKLEVAQATLDRLAQNKPPSR